MIWLLLIIMTFIKQTMTIDFKLECVLIGDWFENLLFTLQTVAQ